MTRGSSKPVKCLVWDLDNTVWSGVLLEDADVQLRDGVSEVIRALDERGILHSIASRNDEALALAKLESLGLAEYFVAPRIGWNAKSASVKAVADELNLGLDALAFIDDDPFERGEVVFELPAVRTYNATNLRALLDRPELVPAVIAPGSAGRRLLYRAEHQRRVAEETFEGPREAFLAGLGMEFTIFPATEDDLARAEELTVRTNQLNTTGRTYSGDELRAMAASPDHDVLMARLTDRFGDYGTIGLALVARTPGAWTLRLLLMSCRVLSRGVGSILLAHVMERARDAGAGLVAELVPNDRNRMMMVTLRFAGFREVGRDGDALLLEADLSRVAPPPPYVDVRTLG